jgi:hypothetical protein
MQFVIPDIPDMAPLFLELDIPDLPPLPEIPAMPPAPVPNFDYDAYKKDGEKYLKEWKKEFDKNFNKEYRKELEAWSKEMAEGAEERNRHIEEWKEGHDKFKQEHEEQRKELMQQREELRQQAREHQQEAREEQQRVREEMRKQQRQMLVIRDRDNEEPNVFYRGREGVGKNFKIKKSIKIKMPKSVKLKMNVRHGEVKLAENTKDLRATLSSRGVPSFWRAHQSPDDSHSSSAPPTAHAATTGHGPNRRSLISLSRAKPTTAARCGIGHGSPCCRGRGCCGVAACPPWKRW